MFFELLQIDEAITNHQPKKLKTIIKCRALNINPHQYLEDIMRPLMSHSSQKLEELLQTLREA